MIAKHKAEKEIEIGELVTVIGGQFNGVSGVLDNVWMDNGVRTYTVVFNESDDSDFTYATAIRRL